MAIVRFLRADHWGIQLPILWLAAAALFLTFAAPPDAYWAWVGWISLLQVLALAGVYTLNDYFDWEQDASRQSAPLASRGSRVAAAVPLLGTSLILAPALLPDPVAIATIWTQVAFGVAYSAPAVRLKERGVGGVLTAAGMQRVPPFVALAAVSGAGVYEATPISCWLFIVGLLFIIEHQVHDLDSDRAVGVSTFMLALTPAGRTAVSRTLYALLPITAAAAGMLLIAPWPDVGAIAAATTLLLGSAVLRRILRRYYAANHLPRVTSASAVAAPLVGPRPRP